MKHALNPMKILLSTAIATMLISCGPSRANYYDRAQAETLIWSWDGEIGGRVDVQSIGQSALGQDILAVRVSDTDGNSPKIGLLIECGIHAREWTSPQICLAVFKGCD